MSDNSFGNELKKLRKHIGISSKILSLKVGKAVTYVSQIERDLIKNPSYLTCRQLLLELGLQTEDAEKMLHYYGIQSKEEKHADSELDDRYVDELSIKINSGYYSKRIEQNEVRSQILLNLFEKQLNTLSYFDNSKADITISNLIQFMKDEEKANLFFTLFENKFSNLNDLELNQLFLKMNKDVKRIITEKILEDED